MTDVFGSIASFPNVSTDFPQLKVKALAASAAYVVAVAWALAAFVKFLGT